MIYGEHFQARKLLVAKASDDQITAAAVRSTVTAWWFADGSFIEWRQFNNHQAFASNGWNITPRDEVPA